MRLWGRVSDYFPYPSQTVTLTPIVLCNCLIVKCDVIDELIIRIDHFIKLVVDTLAVCFLVLLNQEVKSTVYTLNPENRSVCENWWEWVSDNDDDDGVHCDGCRCCWVKLREQRLDFLISQLRQSLTRRVRQTAVICNYAVVCRPSLRCLIPSLRNRSPSATNVVLLDLGVVVIRFSKY